jgi:hypothetical protein
MSYTARYLLSAALIFCSSYVFFHGWHLPKRDVEKATASDANVWTNPYPVSSPAHKEAREFNEWIQSNSELDQLSNGADELAKLELASQLKQKGLARLPTEVLEKYLPLVNKVLRSLDSKTCSEIVKGHISDSQLAIHTVQVIQSFSDAEAETWFATNESAIDAQLHNLPVTPVTKENIQLATLKLMASLPDNQSKAIISNLTNLKTANDRDICAALQTISSQVLLIPEPYRGYFVRLLFARKI